MHPIYTCLEKFVVFMAWPRDANLYKVRMPAKKKHKYQDCCVEVFCRDQMPRAATAADRALAPPLCCGCSLGLDRSPLGGRRRLDAAPRGHSGRASALVGEGVLQYSN